MRKPAATGKAPAWKPPVDFKRYRAMSDFLRSSAPLMSDMRRELLWAIDDLYALQIAERKRINLGSPRNEYVDLAIAIMHRLVVEHGAKRKAAAISAVPRKTPANRIESLLRTYRDREKDGSLDDDDTYIFDDQMEEAIARLPRRKKKRK